MLEVMGEITQPGGLERATGHVSPCERSRRRHRLLRAVRIESGAQSLGQPPGKLVFQHEGRDISQIKRELIEAQVHARLLQQLGQQSGQARGGEITEPGLHRIRLFGIGQVNGEGQPVYAVIEAHPCTASPRRRARKARNSRQKR